MSDFRLSFKQIPTFSEGRSFDKEIFLGSSPTVSLLIPQEYLYNKSLLIGILEEFKIYVNKNYDTDYRDYYVISQTIEDGLPVIHVQLQKDSINSR